MLELPPIPDKEFFSIGELGQIAQLPGYVLRYWETEFSMLRPARRASGQRKYTRQEIELIFLIKDLLYNKKYTIAGAKKHILSERRKKNTDSVQTLNVTLPQEVKETKDSIEAHNVLVEAKQELEEILQMLR